MPLLLKFEREALCGLHLIGVLRNGKSSTSRFKAVDQGRYPRVEGAFEGQGACRQCFEGDEADSWGATPQGRDVGHRTWPSSVSVLGSRCTGLMRVSGVLSQIFRVRAYGTSLQGLARRSDVQRPLSISVSIWDWRT